MPNGCPHWAYLAHLSFNMWCDRPTDRWGKAAQYICYKPYMRFDERLWRDLTSAMVDAGINMVVLDLGDGVEYQSHPEIGVEGAWSVTKLRDELSRLRSIGLEPVPKLNFSTAHDAWLGPYGRMVSTDTYYSVVRDLIAEVSTLFSCPVAFHLGMDEETFAHQAEYQYAVVRQHELWWRDLEAMVHAVSATGTRPWVWSDYAWTKPDVFFAKMPRTVVQSNWYYGDRFDADVPELKLYDDLQAKGYDQMPTGSNWGNDVNFGRTVEYCKGRIAPDYLQGFLHAPWMPTLEAERQTHMAAIAQVADARRKWEAAG
jgi:hypothetical protein